MAGDARTDRLQKKRLKIFKEKNKVTGRVKKPDNRGRAMLKEISVGSVRDGETKKLVSDRQVFR